MIRIAVAATDAEIESCHPVLAELRPHLLREEILARVRRQERAGGYRLAFLEADGEIRAACGFRVSECLAWGRFLYVDDLVTRGEDRSRGYGRLLLDWLVDRAREEGCDEIHLDSGVQRLGAHRFYRAAGFEITSHHFAKKLRRE